MKNYSVTIRTLGTAGDKYKKTLNSIVSQTIPPTEIIIVLAEGYPLPPERIGIEKFIYSDKGMVSQRIAGFKACKSELLLALDDDVEFEPDFVASLIETMQQTNADFVSPIVKECKKTGGVSKRHNIKDWCLGVSCHKALKEAWMVKIWRTGGFIVNTNFQPDKQYYNQSGHGTCVFGKTKALQELHFEEELWLQDTKYALPEDMVMFYKLYLMGNIIAMNSKVKFLHLDAGTSIIEQNRKLQNIYASARNGYIFWHRFIYSCQNMKWLSLLCIIRRIFFTLCFSLAKSCIKLKFCYFKTYLRGYIDAFKYTHGSSYKSLPKIDGCK